MEATPEASPELGTPGGGCQAGAGAGHWPTDIRPVPIFLPIILFGISPTMLL